MLGPGRHARHDARRVLRRHPRHGQRQQSLRHRGQGTRRHGARLRRHPRRGAGRPARRVAARRTRDRRARPPDRGPERQPQRLDRHAPERRVPGHLHDPDRLGRPDVPHGRPLDESARPVARPRGLHPLPERPVPGLRGRAQSQPRVPGPPERHAHRAHDLRVHGTHPPRAGRRRHRPARGRTAVPGHQHHRHPPEGPGIGDDGVDDADRPRGLQDRDRVLAAQPPRAVAPRDWRPLAGRVAALRGAASRSSTPRAARRTPTSCSPARTSSS